MVVKMIRWRPWPPLIPPKKFEATITVRHLAGLTAEDSDRFSVGIKWKGSKGINVLGSLRRTVRRNFTREEVFKADGIVQWDEEFRCPCSFYTNKDGLFHPWQVSFTVFTETKQGTTDDNGRIVAGAAASLNLAEFASVADKHDKEVDVPLSVLNGRVRGSAPTLHLSIVLLELSNAEEPFAAGARPPILSFPRSPCYGDALSMEKEKVPTRKTGAKGVNNILKGLYSLRAKKASHEEEGSDGRNSIRSEDTDFISPVDTDSVDGLNEAELEEVKDDTSIRKSFSYETLAYANHAGALAYANTSSSEDDDWVYYSHRRSDVLPVLDHSMSCNARRGLLPWRKRQLGFGSPKAKGEPLLKKYYGEEGGDDIDFDRRQLSSSGEATMKNGEDLVADQLYACQFGDDNFAVGKWEHKEIQSRDGRMKLGTNVFFASIDQRSERAAGESACTALVAVIADWLHSNCDTMPIKSQFDALIREGSLEWRNLCLNEVYGERFPDKHFDLETVLEAKVRPLSVVPKKSFVGFFHPEGLDDKGFDFLKGAMSFDNIWDEICQCASEMPPSGDPFVYIVSWNDHFFILKVERDAYYIIDTLGERLHEGGNQAFILKFDRETVINRIGKETQTTDDPKPSNDTAVDQNEGKSNSTGKETVASDNDAAEVEEEEPTVVCTGKEACKEYVKNFLAAIPIRELQDDLKKGLMSSTPLTLHQRLQIEFHYTACLHTATATETVNGEDDEMHLTGALALA